MPGGVDGFRVFADCGDQQARGQEEEDCAQWSRFCAVKIVKDLKFSA